MELDQKTQEFYERLRSQLEGDAQWPAAYLFKFIVPADLEKIAAVRAVYDGSDAEITTRDSSGGKYTSVSVMVTMSSPDKVIEKYLEVSMVEGVISL